MKTGGGGPTGRARLFTEGSAPDGTGGVAIGSTRVAGREQKQEDATAWDVIHEERQGLKLSSELRGVRDQWVRGRDGGKRKRGQRS